MLVNAWLKDMDPIIRLFHSPVISTAMQRVLSTNIKTRFKRFVCWITCLKCDRHCKPFSQGACNTPQEPVLYRPVAV